MPIRAGSRFEGETPLRDEHGHPYFGRIIPPTMTTDYVVHYTSEGERMDQLAERFLDDPTRWWEIAEINPEIGAFENLPPNTRLRIPRGRAN